MRILITRPERDAKHLYKTLVSKHYDVVSCPLMEIQFVENLSLPKKEKFIFAFSSANGVRALYQHLTQTQIQASTCFVLGPQSARTARKAGFIEVLEAKGDVKALGQLIVEALQDTKQTSQMVFYIAATRRENNLVDLLAPHKIKAQTIIAYHANEVETLSPKICALLRDKKIDALLVYSKHSVKIFLSLVEAKGLVPMLKHIGLYCLSPAMSEMIEEGVFRYVKIAPHPNEESLLSCLPPAK